MTPDGQLVIDDPKVRQKLIKAIEAYTAIYRKGCAPPDSTTWDSGLDNNRRFLDQAVVMTVNTTLSIPNALKSERPEDYYENTATVAWPLGPDGNSFPIYGDVYLAMVSSTVATSRPRSSSASLSPKVGWRITSTSPVSICCRPCRRCSTSPSGSTRAIRTTSRW